MRAAWGGQRLEDGLTQPAVGRAECGGVWWGWQKHASLEKGTHVEHSDNNKMNTTTTATSPALKALVVLQAITLLAVFGSRPAAPEASAAAPDSRGRGMTLPNAAAQRNEQITLLRQIADGVTAATRQASDSSQATSDRLGAIEKRLGDIAASVRRLEENARREAAPAGE